MQATTAKSSICFPIGKKMPGFQASQSECFWKPMFSSQSSIVQSQTRLFKALHSCDYVQLLNRDISPAAHLSLFSEAFLFDQQYLAFSCRQLKADAIHRRDCFPLTLTVLHHLMQQDTPSVLLAYQKPGADS